MGWTSAFERHTSQGQEPRLESERPVTLEKGVLEVGWGLRYQKSEDFFNSSGRLQSAPFQYTTLTQDLFFRFGLTDNWLFTGRLPIVWSDLTQSPLASLGTSQTEGSLGDAQLTLFYQFLRHRDPTVSLAAGVVWKLPTGSETIGSKSLNITGTGTTDLEFALRGRFQFLRFFAFGFHAGYNLRLPGAAQYVQDRLSPFTNAQLDLGDEVKTEAQLTAALDWVAFTLGAAFTYRFSTRVAFPDIHIERISGVNPRTGDPEVIEVVVQNPARFREWGVHERLETDTPEVSSAGYLLTLRPGLLFRLWEWLDVSVFADIPLRGTNSLYLTDKNGDNPSLNNFMPMQTLGVEAGGSLAFRW